MRLPRLLPPIAAALLATAAVAWPTAAPARTTAAPLPPDLQALLHRGAALRIRAIVARETTAVLDGESWDVTTDTQQIRSSPLQFAVSYGENGAAGHLRYVHGFAYVEVPGLYRVSGGRRWVRATAAELGLTVAQLADAGSVANLNPVTEVDKLLADATSVATIGRVVIARDPTTEFLAQLSQAALPGAASAGLTGIDLQIYIDASGLVKYVRLDVGGIITESTDVLTAAYPVAVHRPRPADTISFARLKELERALQGQQSAGSSEPASASGGATITIDPSDWLARPLPRGLRLPYAAA